MKDTAEAKLHAQLQAIFDGTELPELLPGKRVARQGDFFLHVVTPEAKELPPGIVRIVKGREGPGE